MRVRGSTGLALLLALLLLVPLGARAGDDGPMPGTGSPPWDGVTWRPISDPVTSLHFEVPMLGFRVEKRHLARPPLGVVTATYDISGPEGQEVGIDVFDNPQGLGLHDFFDRYLSFMRDGGAFVSDGTVGRSALPAIVMEQPVAPGILPQAATVCALGGRIIRVTCLNEENRRAGEVYVRVLDTLTIEKSTMPRPSAVARPSAPPPEGAR